MSNLIPFAFDNAQIRATELGGAAWFVASDIAKALGYRDATNMTRLLDDDEKDTYIISTLGGDQEMIVINESGLYHAIFSSRKDGAVKFRKWITNEVLPSIRKYGHYQMQGHSLEYGPTTNKVVQTWCKDLELVDKRQVLDAIEVLAKNYYNSLMVGAVIATKDFTHEMDLEQFKTPHFTIEPEAAFWRDHAIYWTIKETGAISFPALCRSVNLPKLLVDQSLDRLERMKLVKYEAGRSKYRVV